MKYALTLAALALGASATVSDRATSTCCFTATAQGGENDKVEEDTIGELRISSSYQNADLCVDGSSIVDSAGHHCIIYPGTQQFQCIQGTIPGLENITLGDNSDLLHNGDQNWLACPADGPGTDGGYNIFSNNLSSNTTGCKQVTILTGGFSCAAMGSNTTSSTTAESSSAAATSTNLPVASPSVSTTLSTVLASSTSSVVSASATASAASCPKNIAGVDFQYPHLITPVDSTNPDTAYGTQYRAYIGPENSTIFNFDIPTTYTGSCALLFEFPYMEYLDQSAGTYYFSGDEQEEEQMGGLNFALLNGVADADTTYNNVPDVQTDYGLTSVYPGNNYTIATFACPAGHAISYEVSSVNGTILDYNQNDGAEAIGLYLVPCSSA